MIKTIIARPRYLEKVLPFVEKPVIKVFVGQRRVGKSYLLHLTMSMLREKGVPKSRIIYINKELHEFEDIRTDRDLIAYIESRAREAGQAREGRERGGAPDAGGGQKARGGRGAESGHRSPGPLVHVFLDEIQEVERFERALVSLLAAGGYDLYCTGSNARLLTGDLAAGLGGRYVEIRVHALSFEEFLAFHRLEPSPQSLERYIRFGGLPFLIYLPLEERTVYEYIRSIYGAILFKDVIRRHNIRNPAFLERLVLFLADNVGNVVSAKRISDFLRSEKTRISPSVVLDYLGYLRQAYFVQAARRSDLAGKKIFEIGEKYYFEDLGLRHAIVGFRQADIAKVIENLVFAQLVGAGFEVTVGKTNGGGEVDFVCRGAGGEKIYVQAAYLMADEATREREFGRLLAIRDNYPKFVVSMDPMAGGDVKGVRHLALIDFLSGRWQA